MVVILEKLEIILQIANKLIVFNNSKDENKIGYFKTELIKSNITKFLMIKNEQLH